MSSNNNGVGFTSLLTLVFIVMKMTGYIKWGWIWVISPIWIHFIVAIALVFFILLFQAISSKR